MKPLIVALLIMLISGCARSRTWSVAAVRDESDSEYRRLRVEVAASPAVPWPLHLSVSARDLETKRGSTRRWTAQKVGPGLVALTFSEPTTAETKPVTFDLRISARGYSSLHVHHVLAR